MPTTTGRALLAFAIAAVIIAPRLRIGPSAPGVRRDVAAGEEARSRDDGARRALELLEVHAVGVRDEDGVDMGAVPAVDEVDADLVEVRARGSVANGRT